MCTIGFVLKKRINRRPYLRHTIVTLTFIGLSLLKVYKKYTNIFSKKLASIIQQNFKYNYIINLKKGQILL